MSTEQMAFLMGAKEYSRPVENACIKWGIIQPEDKARFIAQLYVESNAFNNVRENTGWRADRLVEVFRGRNGLTPELAKRLVAAGPRHVMNHVYGGEWGRVNLGNTEPDDGWDFIGRGLIQTTGRANYLRTSMGIYGDDRLIHDPEILCRPEDAAESAAWFWMDRRLNGVIDIREVTRRINGGSSHLDKRIAQTNRAMSLINFLTG